MLPRPFAALAAVLAFNPAASAADSSVERGADAYVVSCSACHQANGTGIPGIFPPLANSDYLMADRERSIRIALQGMSGKLVVNGVEYQGVMPPPPGAEDDARVADILTFVRSAWGNAGDAITATEVAAVRAKLAAIDPNKSDPFEPLPKPPAGFKIRDVVHSPVHFVRLATMPGVNWIHALSNNGELYRLEPDSGNLSRILALKDYADNSAGNIDALGLTIDSKGRLYIVTNQRVAERPWHVNRVAIFRSDPLGATGVPTKIRAWLRSSYPWGNSYYNHGMSHIAEGPDGMIYVSSGARTDGGELDGGIFKDDAAYWKGSETEYTAGIWRLDPNKESSPEIEMFARGIRNAWTFAWSDRCELFTASNGPDADMPEELDLVERGKHYGFPYQYADRPERPYPTAPMPPPGLTLVPAIRNLGPAAGGSPERPIATFDPHTSPTGLVFCGPEWPAPYRGKFLMGRFGNFIKSDAGYDILTLDLKRNAAGVYEVRCETFLAPVARPLDLLQVGKKLYVLEYTRPLGTQSGRPQNPGRILELSW
jgi:glucose/arabinose dehydrogenase/cytochrome c5